MADRGEKHPPGPAGGPDPRRSLTVTALVGLCGAALLATGAAQTWATATTRSPALRTVSEAGSDAAPLALPLGLVALAAWGTVLVLRRRARRAAAALGVLASAGAAAAVLVGMRSTGGSAARLLGGGDVRTTTNAWPYAALAGAVLAAAAFTVAWARAPRWPEMSRRYDAPSRGGTGDPTGHPADPATGAAATVAPRSDAELWKDLDEGRDPTL